MRVCWNIFYAETMTVFAKVRSAIKWLYLEIDSETSSSRLDQKSRDFVYLTLRFLRHIMPPTTRRSIEDNAVLIQRIQFIFISLFFPVKKVTDSFTRHAPSTKQLVLNIFIN